MKVLILVMLCTVLLTGCSATGEVVQIDASIDTPGNHSEESQQYCVLPSTEETTNLL